MQNLDKYNFHSHTYRCGHAFGEDEEYIVRAIKEGFKYYGISDHVMFPFLDQPGIRGIYENDFESYLESIKSLKNKYKNDIDLHLGMEVEYSPFLYDYYRDLLKNELEYLIMGQHFHMGQDMYFQSYDIFENAAEKYVEDIIKGMESGLILYVAHPDQLTYYYSKKDDYLRSLCERLIKAAKRTNTPLELNVSKVEYNRHLGKEIPEENTPFPLDMFWEIVGKEKVKVVIGLDTHIPDLVCDYGFNYAYKYAEKYGLDIMSPKQIISRMKQIKNSLN